MADPLERTGQEAEGLVVGDAPITHYKAVLVAAVGGGQPKTFSCQPL